MDKNDKSKINKDKSQKELHHYKKPNLFTTFVILLITLTFVITGGAVMGFQEFLMDIGKERIKNEDGTITIPADAQTNQNNKKQDVYVGKVLGKRIKLGINDEFNRNLNYIISDKNMNPRDKYSATRYFYDIEINKIIGMNNANKLDLKITSQSDYYIQEVGKRYFTDENGDIDYEFMRKNPVEVNQKGKGILKELIYDTFVRDNFENLPLSKDEVSTYYKMDESKVSLKYIVLSNSNIEPKIIFDYFAKNIDKFKKYKLTKLVFEKKDTAVESLKKLKEDPTKFLEIAKKLEEEKKLKIDYDTDYSFIDNFEYPALKEAIKKTNIKQISDSIIDTKIGPIVFYIDDIKNANFFDQNEFDSIKKKYLDENLANIDSANKNKADEFYNYAKKKGFEKASKYYNIPAKSSMDYISFMESSPNLIYYEPELYLDFDQTDDVNFMASLFKNKTGDVIPPRKYIDGYLVAVIADKKSVTEDSFNNLYVSLKQRYSTKKGRSVERDYYYNERKKITIVDNFYYVFKEQDFMPQTEESNTQ